MILIGERIVSSRLFKEYFLCDYKKCLGACCVEGDDGPPLAKEELPIMEQLLPKVWPLLTKPAQEVISNKGIAYTDDDGDLVASIVGDGDYCVFAFFDGKGGCHCAFEHLYRKGESAFPKPISCHLYPIRVSYVGGREVLNYDGDWHICRPAKVFGRKRGVVAYRALEEPIKRAYGEQFFLELVACEELLRHSDATEETH